MVALTSALTIGKGLKMKMNIQGYEKKRIEWGWGMVVARAGATTEKSTG